MTAAIAMKSKSRGKTTSQQIRPRFVHGVCLCVHFRRRTETSRPTSKTAAGMPSINSQRTEASW